MEAVSRIESYGKGDVNGEINDHRHHLPHGNNSTALQREQRNHEFGNKEERVKRMLQEQGVPVFPGLPQSSKGERENKIINTINIWIIFRDAALFTGTFSVIKWNRSHT